MRNDRIDIDIAIPVLNEELRLERGVTRLVSFCRERGYQFRVSIADNGSTDRTAAIADELRSRFPEVHYIRVPQRGVGRALKKVWSDSPGRFIGYMDVDLSTDLGHLTEAMAALQSGHADVINASRLLPGAKVTGRRLKREIASRAYNLLLRALLRVKFTDGMCGFKFMTREAYEQIAREGVQNEEWFFNTEVLIKGEWLGLRIHEIPVVWTDDPNSRAKVFELAVKYSREIWRLKKNRREAA